MSIEFGVRIPPEAATEIHARLAEYGVTTPDLSALNADHEQYLDLRPSTADPLPVRALYSPNTVPPHWPHPADDDTQLLLLDDHFHGRTAAHLRSLGVWFCDRAGNAYIRAPGVMIDVRGRSRAPGSQLSSAPSSARPMNLFSARRAQVVCAILTEPSLAGASRQRLAHHSGVSLGTAQNTVDALLDSGFLVAEGRHHHLVHGGKLLDLWAEAYRDGLGANSTVFIGSGEVEARQTTTPDVSLSGECAVPQLIRHPQTLTIYVDTPHRDELPAQLIMRNRWRRDPHGNITIRRKFWTDLPPASDSALDAAPAPIVYADLISAREPRQAAAAAEFRMQSVRLDSLPA